MKKSNVDRLGHAMKWTFKNDHKLRGAYGETDFKKKTIRVNRKRARLDPKFKRPVNKNATKYPDVLATMVHELHHATHPKATERQTIKAERRKVATMSKKEKRRVYSLFSKHV